MEENEIFEKLVNFDRFVGMRLGKPLIGVDEAGRGPLAGPVVAVAIQVEVTSELMNVNDSKKLSPNNRERIFDKIVEYSTYGVGISTVEEIDKINILNATRLAMIRALENIKSKGIHGFIIVDGKNLKLGFNEMNIIKGDERSFTIACASIMAKVIRDRIMTGYSKIYPNYSFEKHKGYPTEKHLEELKIYGPTPFHRLSFKPVLKLLNEDILDLWYEKGMLSFQRFEKIKGRLKEA